MGTIINIGTTKGNIVGVKFQKKFNDITYHDVMVLVLDKYGDDEKVIIVGWCKISNFD